MDSTCKRPLSDWESHQQRRCAPRPRTGSKEGALLDRTKSRAPTKSPLSTRRRAAAVAGPAATHAARVPQPMPPQYGSTSWSEASDLPLLPELLGRLPGRLPLATLLHLLPLLPEMMGPVPNLHVLPGVHGRLPLLTLLLLLALLMLPGVVGQL